MAKKQTKKTNSKKQKQKKQKFWLYVVEAILLLILVPVAFLYYKIGQIPTYEIDETSIEENEYSEPNMGNYTNIALFGVDSRAN